MAFFTFWVLHRMCRYVEVRHVNRDKSSRYLTLGTVHGPSFRKGTVGKITLFVLLFFHDKVPPTYCCVGTKLNGSISQKMATVKCNFIYSHSVTYIDDTLTV